MPGAPSGLVTIERVSQGKPWAKLCWPVGPKTWLYLSIFPPKTPDQIRNTLLGANKTSKIQPNLAPFNPRLSSHGPLGRRPNLPIPKLSGNVQTAGPDTSCRATIAHPSGTKAVRRRDTDYSVCTRRDIDILYP